VSGLTANLNSYRIGLVVAAFRYIEGCLHVALILVVPEHIPLCCPTSLVTTTVDVPGCLVVTTMRMVIYSVIQKDELSFVRLYFLNYTQYVDDLHNI
jgi:hypothetical protein